MVEVHLVLAPVTVPALVPVVPVQAASAQVPVLVPATAEQDGTHGRLKQFQHERSMEPEFLLLLSTEMP
jgi:hypothetical protein